MNNRRIHPDDDMFCGDIEHYEACGRQFAEFVVRASRFIGEEPQKILDLPCGYGRVTRHLVQRFSPVDVVVADAIPHVVQFCKEQFDVSGIVVTEPMNEFRSAPDGLKKRRPAQVGKLVNQPTRMSDYPKLIRIPT